MASKKPLKELVLKAIKSDRILIVDDEEDLREYLKRSLAHFGYDSVDAVKSAEKALELISEGNIALAMIDLRMPGKGGLWLIRQIRELYADTAVIVVSASHEFNDAKEALNLGAENYISKPVQMEELNRTVTDVLEKRYLMRANLDYQDKLQSEIWEKGTESC